MPVQISIDDDVFAALQSQAEPLVDDVNSVLRRLLSLGRRPSEGRAQDQAPRLPRRGGAARSRQRRGRRAPAHARAQRGSLLPESEYELPILRALEEGGGSAPASHVIERVGEMLDERLTSADQELLTSGLVRWRSRTQFVRLRLAQRGDMLSDSPRGVWEISAQGRERLRKNEAAA
jgi:hypothetical protein